MTMETFIPPTPTFPGFVSNAHHDHDGYDDQWHGNRHYETARHIADVAGKLNVDVVREAAANTLATNVASSALAVAIQTASAVATNVTEKLGAATNLAIQVSASAAQVLAVQNASAQLAATERCCCELKELMRQLELTRIQSELTDAKLTIALNNRRTVIPGI